MFRQILHTQCHPPPTQDRGITLPPIRHGLPWPPMASHRRRIRRVALQNRSRGNGVLQPQYPDNFQKFFRPIVPDPAKSQVTSSSPWFPQGAPFHTQDDKEPETADDLMKERLSTYTLGLLAVSLMDEAVAEDCVRKGLVPPLAKFLRRSVEEDCKPRAGERGGSREVRAVRKQRERHALQVSLLCRFPFLPLPYLLPLGNHINGSNSSEFKT